MNTVGIDARKYFDYGIGTYLQGLLGEYAVNPNRYAFTLYTSPGEKVNESGSQFRCEPVPWKKYSLSELLFLGKRAQRDGVDLLHIPHYTLPLGFRGPSVVTIHDLIHLRFPEYYSVSHRSYARLVIGHAVRNASAVIADSDYVRNDILSLFPVSPDKVHRVHLAAGRHFHQLNPDQVAQFRDNHRLNHAIILAVGGVGPHKDIPTLIRAFEIVADSRKDCDLVFAGAVTRGLEHLVANSRWSKRIRLLGRLPKAALVAVYNAADVVIMTSRYEGFGLPPLEAMACGTPCVVSDAGSLPEIAGDAALICHEGNAAEFAEAVNTVLTRPEVRKTLVERGLRNVGRFSWRTTAGRTLEIYDSVI